MTPRPPSPRLTRFVLIVLTLATAVATGATFGVVLLADGLDVVDHVLLPLFLLLTAYVAQGFWTAALGTWFTLRASSPLTTHQPPATTSPLPRTAIVLPIYNEDPLRVMSGVRAIHDSLKATGKGSAFDLFVLSDTNDPDRWLEEETAWANVCLEANGGDPTAGQIFYRRRPFNTARKSGNLADWCGRWGRLYEFMVTMDADSLMEGETLVEMARRMQADPKLGILQAPPKPVNGETLFARLQQFAAACYGPVFTLGFSRWTGPDGNYYGHNAIIRTAAFMEHCGLPHLPGEAPLGGEILSHDFVEAAMMRRARFTVRIDPDLEGSYEEIPTNLIDFAKRDRRWCQGNLQHVRIGVAKGLRLVSRLHLLMGAMGYLASPLWLLFMILVAVAQLTSKGGADDVALEAGVLFAAVMAMLILPKLFAYLVLLTQPQRMERFGGKRAAFGSIALETAISVLLAPVMMAFHSRFVLETLTGVKVAWVAQQRDAVGTSLRTAWAEHRMHVVYGLAAGALSLLLVPTMFLWLLPVTAGLVLAPVLSSWTSYPSNGRAARRRGLFLIPEETDPPAVVLTMHQHLADAELAAEREAAAEASPVDRFTRAVLDPTFNTLHVSLLRAYGAPVRETPQLVAARHKAIERGPGALSKAEKLAILSHEDTIRWLHGAAWQKWPVA